LDIDVAITIWPIKARLNGKSQTMSLCNLFPFEPVFKGKLEILLEGESEICCVISGILQGQDNASSITMEDRGRGQKMGLLNIV